MSPQHKVTVHLSWKASKNYQSTGIDIGFEVEGKPEDNPQQTFDKAWAFVERNLEAKANEALKDMEDL